MLPRSELRQEATALRRRLTALGPGHPELRSQLVQRIAELEAQIGERRSNLERRPFTSHECR